MFVRNIKITNYKLFKDTFSIDFNVPDGQTKGSGLTILCGENGSGKTAILEAIGLTLQEYRSENLYIENINDLNQVLDIHLNTTGFPVKSVLPDPSNKHIFNGIGFVFKANKRKRAKGDLYGSLVVSKREIIPEGKQKDYELRCEGTTPWGQLRYDQPSLLFLDKNRIYQIKSGSTTATNFDYLLERLSLEKEERIEVCKCELEKRHPLKKAIDKFQERYNIPLYLFNRNPLNSMENAFIAANTGDNIIKLNNLGSGYEMFFSILWAIYRSYDAKRELIIIIDEPELHLHPNLQKDLILLLNDISQKIQIIISTHSPLFIKQLYGINPKFHILKKENNKPIKKAMAERKIQGFLSLNEINFMAFDIYTEEYFNELYETLYRKAQENDESIGICNFDERFFVNQKGIIANRNYKANNDNKKVSYITFIRNVIHHKIDYEDANLKYTDEELKQAINAMRSYL